MEKLENLRRSIDEIDNELMELFEKRMGVVAEVAKYKEYNGIPILDSEREREVIIKNVSKLNDKKLEPEAEEFFEHLMGVSRKYQAKRVFNKASHLKAGDKMENLYGLIGERLSHSFSPAIHSMIMEKTDVKGYYHLFEIEKENLIQACTGLKYLNIKGVNVTIPYKVAVMKALDEISAEAKKIGAVNTICFNNNKAFGFNTDYYGFGMMLDKFGIKIQSNKAVILGTGGAASSIIQYLLDNGINDIIIGSRNVISAREKLKGLKLCSYEEIEKLKGYDIIINCTPCGMYPHIDECAVTPKTLEGFSFAVDLIYNPSETLFLRYAKERGLTSVNGLYMLVSQAVKAQELWNGIKVPVRMVDEIYMQLSMQIGKTVD